MSTIATSLRRRFDLGTGATVGLALVIAAVTLVPVLYVVLGGFRTTAQLAVEPVSLPSPWVFDNYANVLSSGDFWRQVLNSTIVGVGTTAFVMLFGVMAAFVLARYEFRGREAVYTFFTLGLLFPIGVAILPLYLMLRDFGLLGSLVGVILPQVAFGLPLTIVILRPFLRAIPGELEDAAVLDGATRVGFFWRVVLPLSGPGLVTVGMVTFVASWNAYLLPLLVLGSPASFTLPLGVAQFQSQFAADTAAILAFTSLAMLPALLFFLVAERYIVNGLAGAVKG